MVEWINTIHADGTEQWCVNEPWPATLFVERIVGPKSRRKHWVVVSRCPPERWARAKYAPKLAGPFKTLEGAKAAYLMCLSANKG